MQRREWLCLFGTGLAALATGVALADNHGKGHGHDDGDEGHGHGNGHGNGHGQGHNKGYDKQYENHQYRYSDRDRGEIREWYRTHQNNLPPGLAKRDSLPPGLERQLEARGTLPPGLEKKMYRCPSDLERRLPPPPPDCEHVFIGGHVVLLNRKTSAVLDVFVIGR